MADTKITALTAISTVDPAIDVLPIVDVSDTTMAASGTTKKITSNQILGAGGTATLASATITGDLTVRTDKLFVNATGVGIGNTGPLSVLTVSSQVGARLSVRTSDAIFGTVTGGSGFDSLNDSASALVPFACRGSTVTLGSSAGIGLQLDASNNVNISTGNVVMATSGKGIDFSATASGSGTMTSELLNDYEEGTWTGTLAGSTTNPTVPVTATGRYTKIGRQVYVQIIFGSVNTTGASGAVSITGLPFANNASTASQGSILSDNALTFTGSPFVFVDASASTLLIYQSTSNAAASACTHNAGTARYLYANLTYSV